MIGKTIQHYKITEKLGQGGMGVVYKAEDTKLHRPVALKFLPADLTPDESSKKRFAREAQAASALQHNNICTIHAIDETPAGEMFICMEWYDGQTLRDIVREGPVPVNEALNITTQVLEGLSKAHDAGMVHRDIKSANVMVTSDGAVKILDFGLAKLAGQTKVTKTGTTVGTVAYMSPEQARGDEVDQRSDVWSAGVLMYELLKGELPFQGDHDAAVLYGVMNTDPAPLTDHDRGVPEQLDWIVGKALAKDPGDRYQTSSEFLEDLVAAAKQLGDGADTLPSIKAGPRRRKGKSRRPLVALGLVAAAVLVAAAIVFWPRLMSQRQTLMTWEGTPRVAVASFENKTGDPSLDPIAELASETIVQDLGGLDLVETVPLRAGPDAADADIDITGALYREGDRIQFQTRVIDARSGSLITRLPKIYSPVDSPSDGIEQVSQRVLGGLAVRLYNPFHQPPPIHPPTFEAFNEYRLALDGFDASVRKLLTAGGAEHCRRAAELDTTFYRSLTMMACIYKMTNNRPGHARCDTALMHLEELRDRLDEYDRMVVDALKAGVAGDNQAALGVTRRLLQKWPDDQLMRFYELFTLYNLGRYQEALEAYDFLAPSESQERRMVFATMTRVAAFALHALGRYDDELALRKRLIEFFPEENLLRLDEIYAYTGDGRTEEIKRVVWEEQGNPGSRGYLNFQMWVACDMLKAHGHRDEALKLLNEYIAQRFPMPGEGELPNPHPDHARLLYCAERWEEARTIMEGWAAEDPENTDYQLSLGRIAARLGDLETARRIEADYAKQPAEPYSYGAQLLMRARFAALLGEPERAVRLLREAGAQGRSLNHDLFHEADLASLHGYPPFDELIAPKS
jgi:tetratricopeptide (TPR) repeat protein